MAGMKMNTAILTTVLIGVGIPISCKTIICLSLCGYKLRTRPRNLKLKTESRARKEIEKGKLSTINEQSPIQVLRKNIAHKNNH